MIPKKHILFIPLLCIALFSNAYGDCAPTDCNNGGDKGQGLSIIDAYGRRGNKANGLCYRCNWGDNAHECSEGTTLLIFKPGTTINEVIGAFKCRDDGKYDDDWVQLPINKICDKSEVASTATNAECFFSSDLQTPASGSNVVINPVETGCIFCKCKQKYTPNDSKSDCVPAATNDDNFDECDMLVATDLYPVYQQAASDKNVDYNAPTASAIARAPQCAKYIDQFKNNINTTIYGVPLKIDWSQVRSHLNQ